MTSRVEEIFDQAMDVPLDERPQFLERVCGDDIEMRQRVEELLAAHGTDSGFLPEASLREHDNDVSDQSSTEDHVGAVVDRFKLLERVGEGGFGVVWAAQQLEPVKRKVALKIVKPGMDTKQVIARFEAERQALALMDHPNIAQVFDAGSTASGRPYFVMELIHGIPITNYCDQEKLPTEDRVELFVRTCHAVQHAHQKGVIHRDIKPSNVLVTLHDGLPVPKVIDFGVAKATLHPLTDKTIHTQLLQFVGTPAYMSPEQAEMSGLGVDTRADIYSLGVLLYELLTGHTPFDSQQLLAAGLDEMQKVIRERDPLRPSSKVTTLPKEEKISTTVNRRVTSTPRLASRLKGDLDWIVLKCLEKDRTRRYETANGLANDLIRHLQDEPVTALPPSTIYRLSKLWRRNRAVVTTAVLVALALLAATGASVWQANRATQASIAAERNLYASTMGLIQHAWERNDIDRVRQCLAETADHPARGFEWYFWQQQLRLDERTMRGHLANVDSVLFSHDGETIFTGGRDHTIRIWDAATGRELKPLVGHEGVITAMALSSDGTILYAGDWEHKIIVWDWRNRQPLHELNEHRDDVRAMSISRNGILATTTADGAEGTETVVWDVSDSDVRPSLLRRIPDLGNSVSISADGKRLASGGFRRDTMKLCDLGTKVEVFDIDLQSNAGAVLFSPDGKRILSTHVDQSVTMWDSDGKKLFSTGRHLRGFIGGLAFSPDGQFFATGSDDNSVKIWSSRNGALVRTMRGHANWVRGVAFSPDGSKLATAAWDGTVKLWDARNDPGTIAVPHESLLRCLAVSQDGQRFVTGGEDQTAVMQSLIPGVAPLTLTGHKDWVSAVALSPDGQRVVTGSGDGTAILWSATSGQRLGTFRHGDSVVSVAVSPDGKRIVTGGWDGRVLIWNMNDASQATAQWEAHSGPVWALAHAPDGDRLVTGGEDGVVKIWSNDGHQLETLQQHGSAVRSSDWCTGPYGVELIATSSVDGTAKIWDASRRQLIASLEGHRDAVWTVRFSPDGRRAVTAANDAIRVWDTANGRELLLIDELLGEAIAAEFTSAGRSLVAAFPKRQVKVWKAMTRAEYLAVDQEERLEIARVDEQKIVPEKGRTSDSVLPRGANTLERFEGTVDKWLVLLPLRLPEEESPEAIAQGLASSWIDEERLSSGTGRLPRENERIQIANRKLTWRAAHPDDDTLDFGSLLGEGTWWNYCLAYAVCYVYSPRDQSGQLALKLDDGLRVYLNGTIVFPTTSEMRLSTPDGRRPDGPEASKVVFKQGRNILLVKSINTVGPWFTSVRITDTAGQPLTGVRFSLIPD